MKKILIICLLFMLIGCNKEINSTLTLSFIRVDKGDAFIIDVDNKYHIMIDTAKEKDFDKIDQTLKLKGITKLDAIILTHGHKDHVGSFEKIVSNYKVDKLYISAIDNVSYKEIDVRKIANEYDVKIVDVQKNDEINFNDVNIKFWIPNTIDINNQNNNSIITYITHGNIHFLMMGDAEKDEELNFLKETKDIKCDILKLGHHAEEDASSKKFLLASSPLYAIKTANINENPDSYNNDVDIYLKALGTKVYDANNIDVLAYDFISNSKEITIKEIK